MTDMDTRLRALIIRQAAEWYAANRSDLTPGEARRFAAWLTTSPVHVEEYLAITAVDRDLREVCANSDETLEAYLARRRAPDDTVIRPFWSRVMPPKTRTASMGWRLAAVAVAGISALCLSALLWNFGTTSHQPAQQASATLVHLQTRHGEQLTQRLPDNSVVHLNTDTSITVRYDTFTRQVTLDSGQADFEVAHDPRRAFKVFAGPAEVIAVGTNFDVRVEPPVAVVTVIEGRVAVGPASTGDMQASSRTDRHFVNVAADQQIQVAPGRIPDAASAVDAERVTSWIRHQIVFENEPLERVVAEFNRYSRTPIEIDTPSLRQLRVSGVFATDDSESFVNFLRSLHGVRVDIAATVIRVSKN